MTYTFDEAIVSDLYKDANGCRPSSDWLRAYKTMSDRDKQEEWDYLCDLLKEREEERQILQDRAYFDWCKFIKGLAEQMNISEADAIRLDMQSLDCGGDIGFYCFLRNMSYDVEFDIQRALKGK